MSDITLVNMNLLFIRYYDAVDRELHVPLGPLYLVRALEKQGFDVDFRDYQTVQSDEPFDPDVICDYLKGSADILGVSCMANLLPFTLVALRRFKEEYPNKTTVLGGVGPTAVERQILERFPWIDIIVKGEAEQTLPDLLRALGEGKSLSDVPGLFFRQNGEVKQTAPRARITDLDAIDFPAFDRINLGDYAGYGVMTSRGCPYRCTFCGVAPIWGHEAYYRSNENILAEMRLLQETAGVDLFLFQDEFFVSSKERVLSFCEALRRSGLKARWKAFGRVNLTDAETMQKMAEAGCIELRYGIESASDRILELTQKGFTSEDATQIVSEATGVFDRVDTFFIWGFPFETDEEFQQSLFQMISFRMMGARVLPSLFCFLPQTQITKDYWDVQRVEFCEHVLPEYMLTGHEIYRSVKISVPDRHRSLFDFISKHPDIFTGFFQFDIENKIVPKLRTLQEFGFYPMDPTETDGTESCGAHSPHVEVRPQDLATRST